jgi:hypothetical protein
MKTLLLLTLLFYKRFYRFYRRFKSYLSKSSKNDIVSDKRITKVNYDKVRDADFEDLDEQ